MSSRFDVEEFCMNFLRGRVNFLSGIICKYKKQYASIYLPDLSVVTLSKYFAPVCRQTFADRPVSNGRIITVFGFADKIDSEYINHDWYTIRMLVDPLVTELLSIGF